jgi:hypothetical protein
MVLTKLNFNSAVFSDGLPVTLRFADLVGEILTAGPAGYVAPLPFKFLHLRIATTITASLHWFALRAKKQPKVDKPSDSLIMVWLWWLSGEMT